LAHNREGTVPIIAILVDMKNEVYIGSEIKENRIKTKPNYGVIVVWQSTGTCSRPLNLPY
jgi:hypothetical protein